MVFSELLKTKTENNKGVVRGRHRAGRVKRSYRVPLDDIFWRTGRVRSTPRSGVNTAYEALTKQSSEPRDSPGGKKVQQSLPFVCIAYPKIFLKLWQSKTHNPNLDSIVPGTYPHPKCEWELDFAYLVVQQIDGAYDRYR